MTATSLCSSSLQGGPHTFTAALHLCLTSTSPKQFLYVLSHLLCYVPNNNFKSGFTVSPSMINIFFTGGKDPGENSLHPLALDGLGFLVLIQDQFSSVAQLCSPAIVTPWTAAPQVSLSITNSRSLLKLMSIEYVMPSNHLILCHPLLLLSSIFPSIRVFSNESILHIRWPKY